MTTDNGSATPVSGIVKELAETKDKLSDADKQIGGMRRKTLIFLIVILAQCAIVIYMVFLNRGILEENRESYTKILNIENTALPVFQMLIAEACGSVDSDRVVGMMTSKREPIENCIVKTGNQFYIQCYGEQKRLSNEIKINAYTCTDKEDVLFPYQELFKSAFMVEGESL